MPENTMVRCQPKHGRFPRDWTWLDAPIISKAKSSKPFQTCFLSNLIFKGCQWSVPRLRMRQKLFRLSAACRSWRVKLPGRRLPSGTQWKNAFWEIGVLLIDVDFMLILCMGACMNPDETSLSIMFLYIYIEFNVYTCSSNVMLAQALSSLAQADVAWLLVSLWASV